MKLVFVFIVGCKYRLPCVVWEHSESDNTMMMMMMVIIIIIIIVKC